MTLTSEQRDRLNQEFFDAYILGIEEDLGFFTDYEEEAAILADIECFRDEGDFVTAQELENLLKGLCSCGEEIFRDYKCKDCLDNLDEINACLMLSED